MWLSWGKLKSVGFSYTLSANPAPECHLRSFMHLLLFPLLIFLHLWLLDLCWERLEWGDRGRNHLQFDSYSRCFWYDVPLAFLSHFGDLRERMPLEHILGLLFEPRVPAEPSTSPEISILISCSEVLLVPVPFCHVHALALLSSSSLSGDSIV